MFNESSASANSDFALHNREDAVSSESYGLDFDGNHRPDILWHNTVSGENALWLMDDEATGQYRASVEIDSMSGEWHIKSAADFNLDGHSDLLWRNEQTGENTVWLMGGENGAERQSSDNLISLGQDWDVRGVADFNQDNKADLLWRNQKTGENEVWLMGGELGTELLSKASMKAVGGAWDIRGVGDFDGDGKADTLWRNADTGQNTIWFLGGESNLEFESYERLKTIAVNNWQIHGVADFDGDGGADIFWRDESVGRNVVWQMGGAKNHQIEGELVLPELRGTWQPIVSGWKALSTAATPSIQADTQAEAVVLPDDYSAGLDFDGNSQSDIFWHNTVSGQNSLWLMAGDRGNQRQQQVGVESIDGSWHVKSAADFNSDGRPDLLWRNKSTGENKVWFMGGAQGQQRQVQDSIASLGKNWDIKGVADFDGDNQADILWRNAKTGANTVWFMGGENGTDVRAKGSIRSVGSHWDIRGIGDFNADGKADLLWRDTRTGQNSLWFLGGKNGIEYQSDARLKTIPTNWQIQGVADFSGEGNPDIFWRDESASRNVVWQMGGANNTQIEGEIVMPTLSGSWQAIISSWSRSGANFTVEDSASQAPEQNGFDIKFDYRFDTNNWFDSQKKAALEKAAEIWETIILDDFENIAAGTTVHASSPDGSGLKAFTLDYEIDDLVVFAFAKTLPSTTLAQAGATTYESDRNTASVFQPWLGEVEFNTKESWFVDADIQSSPEVPFGQADFLSVAVHELGHILGISSHTNAFRALIQNGKFVGEQSKAINNGNPIPLDSTGSHIKDNFKVSGLGENALDPRLSKGTRKLLTRLDVALLDDIGYTIDYSSLKAVPVVEVLSIQQNGKDTSHLQNGGTYTLRWSDNFSEDVKIDLYEDNKYKRTIESTTNSDGRYTWQVPDDLGGDRFYKIKVSSLDSSSVSSFSDIPFTITPKPSLVLNSPSSNTPLRTNSNYNITWRDNLDETLKIELYQNGQFQRILTNSTASDGSYTWRIPSYTRSGDNYQFRLTSREDSSISEFSDKFSISAG